MYRNDRLLVRVVGGIAGTVLACAAYTAQAEDIVLQWQTANLTEKQFKPIMDDMIAEFQAQHPGVKIEPILVARKDHWTKFVTAAQARKAPCVVSVDVVPAAYNGYLMPLDKFWNAEPQSFRDAWPDDSLTAVRYENKLYGLPSWGGIYGEIYNVELLKKAGLDPNKLPTTWEEYLAWAKKLTGDGHWGTAVLGGPTDTTTRLLLSWIYSNGGKPFNDDMTEARFAKDPKSLEAIKFYLGLLTKEHVAAPGATTLNYLEQTNLFSQNKIAMMRNAFWGIAKVEIDNPSLKGKLVAALPPRQVKTPKVVAKIQADSISSNCPYPQQAWEFIKFQNNKKWSIRKLLDANWMPMRADIADAPEVQADPLMKTFLDMSKYAVTIPLPTPAWNDIASKDLVAAVQKALLNPDQTEEIFKEFDAVATKKLNDL